MSHHTTLPCSLSLSERSTLRKNFDVDDVTEEYKGRVVSRRSLVAFSDDSEDEHIVDDEEEDEEDQQGGDIDVDIDADIDLDLDFDDEKDDEDDEEDGDDEDGGEDDEDDGEDADDDDDAGSDSGDQTGALLVTGLTAQQLKVQQQLALLEEEDEQPTSLFAPRGPTANATSVANASATSQFTKATHVKNQLAWHSQLLNLRIRMQGLVSHANRLPALIDDGVEIRRSFESRDSNVRPGYSAALSEAGATLKQLFQLQTGMMRQNTKIFAQGGEEEENAADNIPSYTPSKGVKRKHDDDEDEPADDDDDDDGNHTEQDEEAELDRIWNYMQSELTPFWRPVQDALISKWNTKTQLSAGQLSAIGGGSVGRGGSSLGDLKVINQSVLGQIESIMLDESRLIKRAHLHRNAATQPLLGRVARAREAKRKKVQRSDDDESHLLAAPFEEVYDEDIYDDNDYYQQQLAEIISHGAGDGVGDSDLLTRASAARKKTRKGGAAVDRRASKGRKLRYTVHPKLANFMAPKAAPITTEYGAPNDTNGDSSRFGGSGFAMDELFMNLFGGLAKS